MPFVPRPVFVPPILVEKLGKAFTDIPMFVLKQGSKSQNSCHPNSSTRKISNFIPSLDARSQSRQNYRVPLASHRGPKLESADGVLDIEFF
ncbi:hypothetical protein AVEN_184556-1 [Araneus ventricosus]|uniref:Uncharacterized protein n=1 Tax=Araneus ventricosus TaxID=182803 RepID=A0A4Y2PJS9_ARAVE|nr:hypothetical protein AVEN_184556-1 [Araneus ventricosus]